MWPCSRMHATIPATVSRYATGRGYRPNPMPSSPKTTPMAATVQAYGSWVRTWVMTLDPQAMAVSTVVSEKGEQWSPNTDPWRGARRA